MSIKVLMTLELLESGDVILKNKFGKVLVRPDGEDSFSISAAHIAGKTETWIMNTDIRPYSRAMTVEEAEEHGVSVGEWKFDDDGDCSSWADEFAGVNVDLTRILTGDIEKLSDCSEYYGRDLNHGFQILKRTKSAKRLMSDELENQGPEDDEK